MVDLIKWIMSDLKGPADPPASWAHPGSLSAYKYRILPKLVTPLLLPKLLEVRYIIYFMCFLQIVLWHA